MKQKRHFSLPKGIKYFIAAIFLIIGCIGYFLYEQRTGPASPTNLHATARTDSTISLAWKKSDGQINDYEVFENHKFIGKTASYHYEVKKLRPETTYSFYIKARDTRGNLSAPSKRLKVTTRAEAQRPTVSQIQVSPTAGDGKTISGTVTISVRASSKKGISKVEFFSQNGGYLIKTLTKAPYHVKWATNPWVQNGQQTLKVIVYDKSNQKAQVSRTVLVKNPITPGHYKRIGYYTGWSTYSNFNVSNVDASMLTQLNYAFAKISSDGKIALEDPAVDVEKAFPGDKAGQPYKGNFYQLIKLKRNYPNLKILISVGGWDGSGRFSDVALTSRSRTIFAKSCLQFIRKYDFDGVDLDWEYPVSGGKAGNISRRADKHNFTLLLKKIRETFNAQSAKDGKKYYLTITGGDGESFVANTELGLIQKYVDSIQLMAYDIHGSWDDLTGLDAPLYRDPASGFDQEWSINDAVQAYLANGVPANKLILGVPFYGRVYNHVKNKDNGLYQTFTGGGSAITFADLEANYLNKKGFHRYWDSSAQVPWLFNGSQFISYDDAQSIGDKTAFIKTMGLGGAMIWELSQDPRKTLLSRVYHDLK